MKTENSSDEGKHETLVIFALAADHYATERERLPYYRAQLAIMQSMLSGEKGRVLDIGCAAGGEVPTLRSLGFRVVGADFSQEMLGFARPRFAGDQDVQFCRADIEHLPFAAESVDHVVCLGVLEFLPQYERAVAEVHRVLRSEGLALFAIPSAISLYVTMERLWGFAFRPLWRAAKSLLGRPTVGTTYHRNLCVPWRYRALLRRHSLVPERSAWTNFFIYPLDHFPNLDYRIAAVLEPLCSWPLLRYAASVYMVSARKSAGR